MSPRWFAIWMLMCSAVALASAWIGGASSNQAAHALLGGLSLLAVIATFNFWLIGGLRYDSLLGYWLISAASIFTLGMAGLLYFFGFNWMATFACAGLSTLVAISRTFASAYWGGRPLFRKPK